MDELLNLTIHYTSSSENILCLKKCSIQKRVGRLAAERSQVFLMKILRQVYSLKQVHAASQIFGGNIIFLPDFICI